MGSYFKPCPFCESEDFDLLFSGRLFYVYCNGCLTASAKKGSKRAAIVAWNKRPECRLNYECELMGYNVHRCNKCRSYIHTPEEGTFDYNYCPYCGRKVED